MPATGFYEWQREGRGKQPYVIWLSDQGRCGFASRWDSWRDERGQEGRTDAIITATPNGLVAPALHKNCPTACGSSDQGVLSCSQRSTSGAPAAASVPCPL